MTASKYSILLVEDDQPQRQTLAGFLRKKGYQVQEAASAQEAENWSKQNPVDLLITDLRLGGPDGIALLKSLKPRHPQLQCLILTAYGTVEDAVSAMKAGAYDFISKPINLDRLEILIEKALERVSIEKENQSLRSIALNTGTMSELVGESKPMQLVKETAIKAAGSKASILILGESGTGKEILARAIHRISPRKDRPFVTVNCAALPEQLIESELFGHEKGAFTGALTEKKGRFEMAHQGTLFLDEIGDIPLGLQVKLLNVLQSGSFERVGSTKTIRVDVRLLAATHRNLEQAIQLGTFRADLYYRINVISIHLPPLRERPEDLPLLLDHFLTKHADLSQVHIDSVDPEVLEKLNQWSFPGNVRELENWIERAVVLSSGNRLTKDDFPSQLFDPGTETAKVDATSNPDETIDLDQRVAQLETDLIRQALSQHQDNKSAAARQLGITERAIRYKIKKYHL